MRMRSPDEVFHDHLRRASAGDVEGDIHANYAEDVVLVDREMVRHGHEGVRDAARQLAEELPEASFDYVTTHIDGEIAYLQWTARATGASVEHGTDTFVIRDGLIRAQTWYYRVDR
jgi:ketosteroid isomerase-like protein